MLSRPFTSLEGWVTCFAGAEVPVFRRTIERLALLREREDELAPAEIGDAVREDPLMTLNLLRFAARRRSERAMRHRQLAEPALPDDFKELGELLNIAPEHARARVLALED